MDFRRNSTKLNENIVKAKTWWARIKTHQPASPSETDPNAIRPTTRNNSADRPAPPSNSPGDDVW